MNSDVLIVQATLICLLVTGPGLQFIRSKLDGKVRIRASATLVHDGIQFQKIASVCLLTITARTE